MATSGRGSRIVGYKVQTAVDSEHHLIVAHEVSNVDNDLGCCQSNANPSPKHLKLRRSRRQLTPFGINLVSPGLY